MGHKKLPSRRNLTPGLVAKAAQAPASCVREAAIRGGRRRGPRRPARQNQQQQTPDAPVTQDASTSDFRGLGVLGASSVPVVATSVPKPKPSMVTKDASSAANASSQQDPPHDLLTLGISGRVVSAILSARRRSPCLVTARQMWHRYQELTQRLSALGIDAVTANTYVKQLSAASSAAASSSPSSRKPTAAVHEVLDCAPSCPSSEAGDSASAAEGATNASSTDSIVSSWEDLEGLAATTTDAAAADALAPASCTKATCVNVTMGNNGSASSDVPSSWEDLLDATTTDAPAAADAPALATCTIATGIKVTKGNKGPTGSDVASSWEEWEDLQSAAAVQPTTATAAAPARVSAVTGLRSDALDSSDNAWACEDDAGRHIMSNWGEGRGLQWAADHPQGAAAAAASKCSTPPPSIKGSKGGAKPTTRASSGHGASDCGSPGSGGNAGSGSTVGSSTAGVADASSGSSGQQSCDASSSAAQRSSAPVASCSDIEDPMYYIENGIWLCELGKGAFGKATLYSVRMPDGSRTRVVVKQLRGKANGKLITERLEAEAHGLRAGAGCPHIVQLYACSKPSSRREPHQLVMEYVGGGTLESHIAELIVKSNEKEQGPTLMSYSALRTLACQLLAALAQIHAHGIIHRDLKPANILMQPSDDTASGSGGVQWKLADFGLAQVVMPDGQGASAAGTPMFMAPETLGHLHSIFPEFPLSNKQDLASLGFILAKSAWHYSAAVSNVVAFKYDGASLPASWDPDFADLVLQLTKRNPFERISAEAALQHPFITKGRRS